MSTLTTSTATCDRCQSEEQYDREKEKLPKGWLPFGLNQHLCTLCGDDRRRLYDAFIHNAAFTLVPRDRRR